MMALLVSLFVWWRTGPLSDSFEFASVALVLAGSALVGGAIAYLARRWAS